MLTQAICLKRRKTRVTKVLLILVLSLIGWENAANFLDQSYNEVKQQSRIIFHNKLGIFCDSYTTQNNISVTVSTSAISLMKFGREKKVVTTYFPLTFLKGSKRNLSL